MRSCKQVLWVVLWASALPVAAASKDSCFVHPDAVRSLSNATVEPVDKQLSVLRPCAGKVMAGAAPVEVIFSTGAGFSERTRVAPGEAVQDRLRAVMGPGKQLVDIWPRRALLAAALDLLNGRPSSLSGASGFEGADGGLPMAGELLPLPELRIHLRLHRWDLGAPVTVAQAKWSTELVPRDGVIAIPVPRLVPGELRLSQGTRVARLQVVSLADVDEVVRALNAIDADGGDDAQRAARRAVLLQENQFQVNALSELFSRR